MISAKLSVEEAKRGLTFFGGYDFRVKETVTASLSFISSPCLRCVFYLSTRDQIIAFKLMDFQITPLSFLRSLKRVILSVLQTACERLSTRVIEIPTGKVPSCVKHFF